MEPSRYRIIAFKNLVGDLASIAGSAASARLINERNRRWLSADVIVRVAQNKCHATPKTIAHRDELGVDLRPRHSIVEMLSLVCPAHTSWSEKNTTNTDESIPSQEKETKKWFGPSGEGVGGVDRPQSTATETHKRPVWPREKIYRGREKE